MRRSTSIARASFWAGSLAAGAGQGLRLVELRFFGLAVAIVDAGDFQDAPAHLLGRERLELGQGELVPQQARSVRWSHSASSDFRALPRDSSADKAA